MSRLQNLPDAAPRLVVVDGGKLGIKTYGADNGYPQRMKNLYNASVSAKMCAELYASYIIGKGFEDKDFYKAKINDIGLTPDKLLRLFAGDGSEFRGFALHINYNALYQVDSVSFVPFENCRLGDGEYENYIGIYDNWYNSIKGGSRRKETDITFVHKYNPDPVYIEKQIEAVGGWDNYNGQIFYYSKDNGTYPLATIDPCLNDVEAEIESALTRKNNLKGNFQLKTIWIEKGQTENSREEQEVVDRVNTFMGSEGSPVAIVFTESETLADVPEMRTVASAINDKLFQYTDEKTVSSIYRSFSQPAILHSDYKATSGYNEGQLPQSMAYYNAVTEPDRIFFEEVYTEVFSNFKENINPSGSYKITPLSTVSTADLTTESSKPLIETIGIGGTQALQAILADSATTPEQKKNTLVIVFGLKPEDAALLAGITTGTIDTPEE